MRTTNHKNRNKTETGKIGNHKKSNLLRLPIVLNFANCEAVVKLSTFRSFLLLKFAADKVAILI